MSKINDIYFNLCLFTVFKKILETDIFKTFIDYCEEENNNKKIKLYSNFVFEIYNKGTNLSKITREILFKDENIYVKKIAKNEFIDDNIKKAVNFELQTLKEFSLLTPDDFLHDLNIINYLPSFDVDDVDLIWEYQNRITNIYHYGYGIFSSNAMFSVNDNGQIIPIISADKISINKFIGYEDERNKVENNTIAFLEGRSKVNVLLYGDAGTGKSSTVKAIVNKYFDRGLRLIEIRKNQLLLLPKVMGEINDNPLKFIIFIDDLSFNKNDDNFSMLKAILEGSASVQAQNTVIYATSNRCHIIKETFLDRESDDIHRNDTVQETLSLSQRFGLTVLFAKPDKKLYLQIVYKLAKRNNIKIDDQELEIMAEAFALKRGNRSPRCAEQFIESLM